MNTKLIGCIYSDIHRDRKHGGVSVLQAYDKFRRYLRSVVLHHRSSVETNAYQSDKVLQALQIVRKLDYDAVARLGDNSIMKEVSNTRNYMPCSKRHNRYQVCNEMFWRTWDKLNKSFKMNSSNLAFLVEMMVSQLFWMTGESFLVCVIYVFVLIFPTQESITQHGRRISKAFRSSLAMDTFA